MRIKTQAIAADGGGGATLTFSVPTSRLVGVFIDLDTLGAGATFVVKSLGRTIVTVTTPAADTFIPVGELLVKSDGTASASYGRGGAAVHSTVEVDVTGASADSAGAVSLLYE